MGPLWNIDGCNQWEQKQIENQLGGRAQAFEYENVPI